MTIDKGIFIRNIYYMLTYAFQELRQNNYEEIARETFSETDNLFAEILVRGISCQLKQGLHREYVSHTDTLTTLKGKIDFNGTIRNLMQKRQRLDCTYDELSENNLFNQILKTTVNRLIKSTKVNHERKGALRRLLLFFDNVETIDITSVRWNALHFDRNNKRYRMLIHVCYFIMEDLIMTTEHGTYKMQGFSDNMMHRLYEKFVLEYYKRHHPELNARVVQIKWNINPAISTPNILPNMETDILLTLKERTLIIDTKYYGRTMQEKFGKRTILSNNLYQIHSYIMNYDTTHQGNVDGMLLYAKTEEEITPNGVTILNDGNKIYYRTLDLNKDFQEITSQLDGFVRLPFSPISTTES